MPTGHPDSVLAMATDESDEEFLSALREKLASWQAEWRALHSEPPDVLYHYTNAAGFLGIVTDEELWASNAAFLNDSTELIYMGDILADVLNELRAPFHKREKTNPSPIETLMRALAPSSPPVAPTWAEQIILSMQVYPAVFESLIDVFVSCFCPDGDLLSQWRGYPSSGGGYAVGVRSAALVTGPGTLRRVVYEPEKQRQLLRDLLAPISDAVAAKHESEDGGKHYHELVTGQHLASVASSLLECGYCFKHPKFTEEDEWRLVVTSSHLRKPVDPQPLVRATPNGLLPYVRRALPHDQEDQRPLAQVIVGPGPRPKLAADAAAQLLRNAGYERTSDIVMHSAIPLRV